MVRVVMVLGVVVILGIVVVVVVVVVVVDDVAAAGFVGLVAGLIALGFGPFV